jgi:TnpA family transposase
MCWEYFDQLGDGQRRKDSDQRKIMNALKLFTMLTVYYFNKVMLYRVVVSV